MSSKSAELPLTESTAATIEPAPHAGRWRLVFRVLLRARFLMVLLLVFLVIAGWHELSDFWETTAVWLTQENSKPGTLLPDTEYFCPMCPGVLSQMAGEKCPVCKMPLVARHHGEAVLLPEGVTARMQLSPYRMQLVGVETAAVAYQPLERQWSVLGQVEANPALVAHMTAPVQGIIAEANTAQLWEQVSADSSIATINCVISSTDSNESAADLAARIDPLIEWLRATGVDDKDIEVQHPHNGSNAVIRVNVRAGRAGRLARVSVNVGDVVSAGAPIAEIMDLSSVRVVTSLSEQDAELAEIGQYAQIHCGATSNLETLIATLAAMQPVTSRQSSATNVYLHVENPQGRLRPGMLVDVTFRIPMSSVEPFRSMPHDPPPLTANEPREIYYCAAHPNYLYLNAGTCPFDERQLEGKKLTEHQRLEWQCPSHPHVHSSQPDQTCHECKDHGIKLVPRVVTFQPAGQVLVVPESAVIDTGTVKVVYVETGPGMFDGVRVLLSARCGNYYAVTEGLQAGERVVTSGAFLLDAETRLNPSFSASYFGAGARGSISADGSSSVTTAANPASEDKLATMDLAEADRVLARSQIICPITQLPLGSMGKPTRIRVADRIVLLCCKSCVARVHGAAIAPSHDSNDSNATP